MQADAFKSPVQRWIGNITKGQIDLEWLKIPYLEMAVEDHRLRYVASNRLGEKRVETLFSKEPTTIPWLDAIAPGEVLVDIGANVGMYTLYAAVVSNAKVFAFEPEALNYAELNKNIFVNEAHNSVTAFCLALSDVHRIDRLLLGGFAEGLSHHDFGENTWVSDKDFGAIKTSRHARLTQGCVSYSLDMLVELGAVPMPHHIKIDVDGLENKVVAGAWKTLTDPRLQSVLIEVDHRIPTCAAIVQQMLDAGWRYSIDQLRTNRKVIFTEVQIAEMRQRGVGGLNYIFFRDDKYAQMYSEFLRNYRIPWVKK